MHEDVSADELLQQRSGLKPNRIVEDVASITPDTSYVIQKNFPKGHGAFSTVYIVQRLVDGMLFAAKFIHTAGMASEAKRRVVREIDNMERVHHFACVHLEEHFLQADVVDDDMLIEDDDQPLVAVVLILEFMNAGDLGSHLERGQQFVDRHARVVFFQMLAGLHHIHQHCILHRDIGIVNMMVSTTGLVKIGDFGFSNAYETDSFASDAGVTILGTRHYRPPEVWRKERYGASADIWALGVLMYELVARRWAFGPPDHSVVEKCVTENEPSPLDESECSPELAAMIFSMLVKDPHRRPTAQHLLQQHLMQDAMEDFRNSMVAFNNTVIVEQLDELAHSLQVS